MMEPLSAVGLVGTVIQLAITAKDIVSDLWKYYDAAPQRAKDLPEEMETLCNLLDS